MKICVIIPTYNEEKRIADLITAVRAQALDVLVVDDGSRDDTFRRAENAGARVVRNPINEGKGSSLIKGFSFALANGYDAVITMDGDGQHLPEDIPRFLEKASSSASGILIGNRMRRTRAMPLLRLITNKLMSWLISRMARQHIPDTQCGFRFIRREVLEKVRLSTCNYETESELLVKGARSGYGIESLEITTVYGDEKSRINPLVDTLRFFWYLRRELHGRARPHKDREN